MLDYAKIASNEPDNFNFLDDLRCLHAGKRRIQRETPCQFEPYEHLRMVYVASGTGVMEAPEKSHVLRAHDVCFLFPGHSYYFRFHSGDQNEIYWLDMRGKRLPELLNLLQVSMDEPTLCGVSNPDFFNILRIVKSAYANPSMTDFLHFKGTLYRLCAILLSEFSYDGWDKITLSDKSIAYKGAWSKTEAGGGMYYTSAAKSFLEYTFEGCGVKWYGVMNYDCGIADILIDGHYMVSVDTYSPERLSQQLLYSHNLLSHGKHVIKLICTGTKNHLSSNCDVCFEGFQIRRSMSNMPYVVQTKSRMVNKAILFMKGNYINDISIAQLAAMYNVSRSYFSTSFKSETGVSPKEYLCKIRLETAKEYLSNSSYSIMEIAKLCGYKDVFYFMRHFKERETFTPSQFRKMHHQA